VQSVGAKFVELPLEAADAEDKGGYAKAQDESFYRRQREMMAKVVAASDVVVTTAAVPGMQSPVLVTADMVASMAPGSVIVDLAAERGGNCALTKADEVVSEHGVTVFGPTNLPSTVPYHASQMYARNVATFVAHLMKEKTLSLDLTDEITRETLVAREGQVVHERVKALAYEPTVVGREGRPKIPTSKL
jgi:proton-translocating NAD(P)+ transhydrogenase subunit alpha